MSLLLSAFQVPGEYHGLQIPLPAAYESCILAVIHAHCRMYRLLLKRRSCSSTWIQLLRYAARPTVSTRPRPGGALGSDAVAARARAGAPRADLLRERRGRGARGARAALGKVSRLHQKCAKQRQSAQTGRILILLSFTRRDVSCHIPEGREVYFTTDAFQNAVINY